MDATSLVAGALVVVLADTVAFGVEPPPYRAIVFEDEIGDGIITINSSLNLSRWPATDITGDGLRFRFASDTLVVGTVALNGIDPEWLRAAIWRIGVPERRDMLLGPNGEPTIIADANLDGTLVGAVLLPGPDSHALSVRAAAWRLPPGDLGGAPELLMVFEPGVLYPCDETEPDLLPDTMLSAVGPWAVTSESAMVAGTGGLVGAGNFPDGFLCELPTAGPARGLKRLPGTTVDDWCGTWDAPQGTRSTIGQCIAWGGSVGPASWSDYWVIGSAGESEGGFTSSCVDTDKWDLYRWAVDVEYPLIPHCRGCPREGDPPGIPECVEVPADGGPASLVTDLRLSSFAPQNASGTRPLALGGIIDVRTAPLDDICWSNICANAHAAVVLSHTGLATDQEPLFDLHTVLPQSLADRFLASGIARIYPWSQTDGDGEITLGWVAVGAVGNKFGEGDADIERRGCIWLGQIIDPGNTEWCAFDINPLTIMPAGMNIKAIHDINTCGVAVGVASQEISGSFFKRLVYLTEAADLNGDLVVDGTDLALFMPYWRSGCPGYEPYDLDGDGCIGGGDLGLLLAAWGGNGPGCGVSVALSCHGSPWGSPLRRYPFIGMAANFLGFESLDDLGDALLLLQPDSALGLCEVVDAVATAMEGGE